MEPKECKEFCRTAVDADIESVKYILDERFEWLAEKYADEKYDRAFIWEDITQRHNEGNLYVYVNGNRILGFCSIEHETADYVYVTNCVTKMHCAEHNIMAKLFNHILTDKKKAIHADVIANIPKVREHYSKIGAIFDGFGHCEDGLQIEYFHINNIINL